MFGRKKKEPERVIPKEDPVGEKAWDFRNSERPSDRTWRWHLNDVGGQKVALGIAGIKHRINEVTDFLTAAFSAEESSSPYGILLEPEPSNPHDPNAIKVMGWIEKPTNPIQLGYLYREDIAQIAKEFPPGTPLAAALWRVYMPKPENLWVGVRLLIPAKRDPWWSEHEEEKDFSKRTLCSDRNCIGVIGTDRRCKECKRPYGENDNVKD